MYDQYLTAQEAADWCELRGLQSEIKRRTAFHKDRIGSETLKRSISALQADMDLIVETALTRHLELWAESLDEKVEELHFEVENTTFTLNEELYTGPVFCKYYGFGSENKYFTEKTECTVDILYSRKGKIICHNVLEKMIPYFADAWYRMELPYITILFNIGCEKPMVFAKENGGSMQRLNDPMTEVHTAFTKSYNGVFPMETKNLFCK